jgi:CheY-like chemotaxis protein
MDHLMPGMDGFQAVQSIKNNPRTATIPIMMYTSQEGELYLGQARALGAVGVLPKQIKPADVSKVLYDLRLVPDRRNREQSTFTPLTDVAAADQAATDTTVQMPVVSAASSPVSPEASDTAATATPPVITPPVLTPEMRTLIESTIRGEVGELRRMFTASFDAQSDRILHEVRSLLPDPPSVTEPRVAQRRGRRSLWGWAAASAALLAALTLGALLYRQAGELDALRARVGELQTQLAAATERPAPEPQPAIETPDAAAPAAGTAISAATLTPISEFVPYGEVPLSGARVESVRSLLERLATEGFRGIVEITTYAGRYCLKGTAPDALTMADDAALHTKCESVGNPFYDSLSPAARQSMEFANVAARVRKSTQGAIDVRVTSGDSRALESTYPAVTDTLTAGEWNKAAAANNRIDIRLKPAG